VYGLLYRSDRDYNEAIKAYKQALKIDPENLQILRDLSMLQIQMRDLSGFLVTRNTILTLKPNGKINWMAFALAKHMMGDLDDAVKVIDIYLGTLSEGSAELGRCYEASELAMYKNSMLAELPNNFKTALDHLSVCEGIVVDRGAWLMTRGEYQLKLKDFAAARQSALLMIQRGMTENHRAHSMYMCAVVELQDAAVCDEALKLSGTNTLATMLPLTEEQRKAISEAYQTELVPYFRNSHAVQRIPYTLLEGEELRRALDIRCRKDLTKGVPSLCQELISYVRVVRKGRYVQPDDLMEVKSHPVFMMLMDMVEGYIACLASESKFSKGDEDEESPSTLLWAWYLRAGLHELAGEYSEGIALCDKCIEHTPTAVDVYELKARLIKASGDIKAAVECIDKGRDLDRQDRYINNQTTKYMLQAGMEDEGLKRISLFTRHEGNAEQNLFDMQCSWYELELAACLARKEEWGKSLKKYGKSRDARRFVCSWFCLVC
jgi:tetratricopeptide (TPR) repeat protein